MLGLRRGLLRRHGPSCQAYPVRFCGVMAHALLMLLRALQGSHWKLLHGTAPNDLQIRFAKLHPCLMLTVTAQPALEWAHVEMEGQAPIRTGHNNLVPAVTLLIVVKRTQVKTYQLLHPSGYNSIRRCNRCCRWLTR